MKAVYANSYHELKKQYPGVFCAGLVNGVWKGYARQNLMRALKEYDDVAKILDVNHEKKDW